MTICLVDGGKIQLSSGAYTTNLSPNEKLISIYNIDTSKVVLEIPLNRILYISYNEKLLTL